MSELEKIGIAIAMLRRKRNLTQENLVEMIGETHISLATLKRIEGGKIKGYKYLKMIADALKVSVNDIIPDDLLSYFENDYLDNDTIEHHIWIKNTFYLQKCEGWQKIYPITTLMEFLIYFPLMDKMYLTEALRRIDGDIFGNENYVLYHLKRIYDDIPNSPAKHYADYEAHKMNQAYFRDYVKNEEYIKQYEEAFNEHKEGYEMYSKLLQELRDKTEATDEKVIY